MKKSAAVLPRFFLLARSFPRPPFLIRPPKGEIRFSPPRRPMARPRFRFGLVRAPHEPPTSGGYRGALVRLQARDGFRTSDK